MSYWIIPLSIGIPPLSLNKKMHWAAETREVKSLRREAKLRAKSLKIPACKRIAVRLVYRPRDNRTRDPSNLIPTQKPLLDGLVDAGIVPDDNPKYVDELMPDIRPPEKGKPSKCWLEVRRLL